MEANSIILGSVAWLGTYLIHSTLFLGAAWFLTRQRMLRAPRLTERVWRLALFGGLLTASVQVIGGTRPAWATWMLESEGAVAQLESSPHKHKAKRAELFDDSNFEPMPLWHDEASAELEGAELLSTTEETGFPAQQDFRSFPPQYNPSESNSNLAYADRKTNSSPGPSYPGRSYDFQAPEVPIAGSLSSAPSIPWKDLVLATWVVAGGLGLIGFLWACSCLIARMSDRRRIQNGPLKDQLDELRQAAGLRHEVKLFASTSLEGPITYGWLRPRICLPLRALSDLSSAEQRSLLAHEMAHVMRHDPLWFSLYTLIVRVLCLQPLNRLARRELLESAELLCDDWAVRWTGQRLGLASCLTEIAQWILKERRPAMISAGMAEHSSSLGVRVERLLVDRQAPQPEPRHRWWSPTATGLLALAACAAPGFSSTGLAAEPEANSIVEIPALDAVASALIETYKALAERAPLERSSPLPEPEPASNPEASSAAPVPTQPMPMEWFHERSLLNDELELLQGEIDALRIELADSPHRARFQAAFQRAEARVQKLRLYQERLEELLVLTQPTSTHPQ